MSRDAQRAGSAALPNADETADMLFVSPRFLFPADSGGKIRTIQVLKGLKGGRFQVTLVSPAPRDARERFGGELSVVCDRFLSWPEASGLLRHRIRRYAAVLSDVPVAVASDRSSAGAALVADCLQLRPSVAVFDFPHSAVLAPTRLPVPSVLFTHNVESWIFERHAQVAASPLTRLIWRQQHQKMSRFERESLGRFDTVIAVSEKDAAWFRDRLGHQCVRTIPTGVDLDYFTWSPPAMSKRIVFTGSMDWPANRDGIEYFMQQVWPQVVARVPDAAVRVIGRSPPAGLVARAPRNWEFTGFVDDVRPHAAGAALAIIPLRVGGGTRIKAYEAMALGIPVVSTSIGVEGLPVSDGEHYLCADDAAAFAGAVVRLLGDSTLAGTLSRQARALVESRYSNKKVAKVFESICLDAIAASRPSTHAQQTAGENPCT